MSPKCGTNHDIQLKIGVALATTSTHAASCHSLSRLRPSAGSGGTGCNSLVRPCLCRRHPAWLGLCARNVRSQRLWGGPAPMTPLDIDDFVLWASIGVILGGRIGYVLFYNPANFASHPIEIIQPWKGGMSFHGGFAGVVVAVVLFARSRNIPVLSLGDVICAVYPIGPSSAA